MAQEDDAKIAAACDILGILRRMTHIELIIYIPVFC